MAACGKLLRLPIRRMTLVIVTVIDGGPQCLVEQKAGRYVIDASVPVAHCSSGRLEQTDSAGDGKTVSVTEPNRARSGSGSSGQGGRAR